MCSMLAELAGQLAALETRCFEAKASFKCTQERARCRSSTSEPEAKPSCAHRLVIDQP